MCFLNKAHTQKVTPKHFFLSVLIRVHPWFLPFQLPDLGLSDALFHFGLLRSRLLSVAALFGRTANLGGVCGVMRVGGDGFPKVAPEGEFA